ncbi:Maltose O-acetyltransferase, variant 2 [Balamuthia mandrillaris]
MENQQQQPQTTTSSEANVDATSKELENMLSGELYNASDPLLVQMRNNARKLLRAYNQSTEEEKEKRTRIISELFLKAGEGTYMEPPFYCDYGRHISVGRNFYMNFNCVILDCAHVDIGDNVLCGPNVQIYAATHPLEASVRILVRSFRSPLLFRFRLFFKYYYFKILFFYFISAIKPFFLFLSIFFRTSFFFLWENKP